MGFLHTDAAIEKATTEKRQLAVEVVSRESTGDNRYRVVVAANEKSRNVFGYDLRMEGVDFSNYLRDPVVLFAHNHEDLPVARSLDVTRNNENHITADFEFLPNDERAQRVKNAWDLGFLRAASISFLPTEVESNEDGALVATHSDMLEWSIVNVPADPDSLKVAARSLETLAEELTGEAATDPVPSVAERLADVETGLAELEARTAPLLGEYMARQISDDINDDPQLPKDLTLESLGLDRSLAHIDSKE